MKIIISLLSLLLIVAPVGTFCDPSLMVEQRSPLSQAPMNPKYVDYLYQGTTLSGVESESGTFMPGHIPEPFLMPRASGRVSLFDSTLSSDLPTSYDLRTMNKLTSVKNQGNCGSCWAFATYGSLESSLMPSESWDFSENNLKNRHGFDLACCAGGNRAMSTAYLARWDGPVSEADDLYNTESCTSASGLSVRKHVQDAIFIPDRTSSLDNDALKNAVIEYGAIYTSFYWSSGYYNSSTKAYYYPSAVEGNHAVCIVGWNDNFPASSFSTIPPGNGAFLIKNSWGTSWADSGYFWISYYDANIGTENAAFLAEPTANYDTIYGYDDLGMVGMVGYGTNTCWAGMIFTASSYKVLRAVSLYALVNGTTYQLKIYRGPTSNPATGTLVSTKTGTISKAGYHTIRLDTPVLMPAGTKYSCVVKITTPGYNYPIACEFPYADYSSGATASSGQTYVSSNETSWMDIVSWSANTSVCMKTFASDARVTDFKGMADGVSVQLTNKTVSGVYGDCLYVTEPGIPSGIRVEAVNTGFSDGDVVTVTGTLGTYKPDGVHAAERNIQSASIVPGS